MSVITAQAGLPHWNECPGMINIKIILWLRTLVLSYGMIEYAKDRYGGLATSGGQSTWYPGGRAEQALALRSEIVAACQGSKWASDIPQQLADMDALLGKKGAATAVDSGGARPSSSGALLAK